MSVLSRQDLAFDQNTYEKCLKAFQIAEEYLGIKLIVHADDAVLEAGQIFVFNHFARFETVIPVYIFYQRFKKFTRTITDHHLFEVNDKLTEFLCDAGAVPNNMPALLPFLASEILKGHKVVIFPEGEMVKNKGVLDADGQFGILSNSKQGYRKHHRGAAVLAVTLDLFKRRIQGLFDDNDQVRLDHWCQALEFEDHEQLRKSIVQPTLVVPASITFTPLRIGSNFLSRTLSMMAKELSPRLLEEVIIEGNILLKNTDMDIRFGKPIEIHPHWSIRQKWLVKKYFLSINSLEEFFSLKQRAKTVAERTLNYLVYRETVRIRDEYIKGIYQGVTVNTMHLASVLVFAYFESGEKLIKKCEFHLALYYMVKAVQQLPDIHLNISLSNPDLYHLLYKGKTERFIQFLETAKKAALIEETSDYYVLRDKLEVRQDYHQVRLENPLEVSANEVTPIQEITAGIAKVIDQSKSLDRAYLSAQLWDDELRAFAWDTEKYSSAVYCAINAQETAYKDKEPYLMAEHGVTKIGVLLVHGFLASPGELIEYGKHVHEQGFNVLGVRLSGHGTSPCDLNNRRWEDWLESVRRGYEILAGLSSGVVVVGFSAGGALSLLLGSEKPDKLQAIISVCAAIKVQDKGLHFAPFIHKLNQVLNKFPRLENLLSYKKSDTYHGDTNYRNMPIQGLTELKALMKEAYTKLDKVTAPVLIVQSNEDVVVDPHSAELIEKNISSEDKQLLWVESENHHLIRENVNDTWTLLDNYLAKFAIGTHAEGG